MPFCYSLQSNYVTSINMNSKNKNTLLVKVYKIDDVFFSLSLCVSHFQTIAKLIIMKFIIICYIYSIQVSFAVIISSLLWKVVITFPICKLFSNGIISKMTIQWMIFSQPSIRYCMKIASDSVVLDLFLWCILCEWSDHTMCNIIRYKHGK